MTFQTWETPRPRDRRSAFDWLIDEVRCAADERDRRRRSVAAKRATASMMKSLAAAKAQIKLATPRKLTTPLLITTPRPGCGTILAKAMAALNSDGLSAGSRGHLMLALGKIDPEQIRQAKRAALDSLNRGSVRQ